jgi:hypothetical protein
MEVIRQQRPRIHRQCRCIDQTGHALDEILPVGIILKDPLALGSPRHHMVENSRGIESGTAWHEIILIRTQISLQRPLKIRDAAALGYTLAPQGSVS